MTQKKKDNEPNRPGSRVDIAGDPWSLDIFWQDYTCVCQAECKRKEQFVIVYDKKARRKGVRSSADMPPCFLTTLRGLETIHWLGGEQCKMKIAW